MKILRFFCIVCFCVSSISYLHAQNYVAVDEMSTIKFTIKNIGINTSGTFKGLEGAIHFIAADPSTASFTVSIDAATINTNITARDNHLRKEEYFNVKQFPRIHFVSKQVTGYGQAGMFIMTGTLTIKGIAKEISFPFKIQQQSNGILFIADFKLNRREFSIGSGSMVMSDNLSVSLSVFAKKK